MSIKYGSVYHVKVCSSAPVSIKLLWWKLGEQWELVETTFHFLTLLLTKMEDGIKIWVDIYSSIYSGGYVNFLAKMFIYNFFLFRAELGKDVFQS